MTAVDRDATATRVTLHQVAVHILARRRQAVTGRIGLRPAPDLWNAPFGAVLRRADLDRVPPDERRARAVEFVARRLSAGG
jgi:hypothetical protein